MIINQSGITLRLPVEDIRVMGRATQGVRLIDLTKRGDKIASVCKVDSDPEEEIEKDLSEDISEVSEKELDSELKEREAHYSEEEQQIQEDENKDDASFPEE